MNCGKVIKASHLLCSASVLLTRPQHNTTARIQQVEKLVAFMKSSWLTNPYLVASQT